MSADISPNVIEIIDQLLHLDNRELRALFMALGETLSQRDQTQFAKTIASYMAKDLLSPNLPTEFSTFTTTLYLIMDQVTTTVETHQSPMGGEC